MGYIKVTEPSHTIQIGKLYDESQWSLTVTWKGPGGYGKTFKYDTFEEAREEAYRWYKLFKQREELLDKDSKGEHS